MGKQSTLGPAYRNDYRCMIEHEILGSTCLTVDNPKIPYAILAGVPVDEVNLMRTEKNKGQGDSGPIALGVFFGLPVGNIVFYEHQPVDPKTLEVGLPKIIGGRSQLTQKDLPEEMLVDLHYVGQYQEK